MKYSIILPVYNVEAYLARCLDSILSQDYQNYEIIAVNDGSVDNSLKILKNYEKKDKRIKVFTKKNGGLSDARNYGVLKATGDYIIFLDSDDYWNKELLKKINAKLQGKKIDLLKFSYQKVTENGSNLESIKGYKFDVCNGIEAFNKLSDMGEWIPVWQYVINLNFWKDNNFSNAKGKVHEDFGLTPYMILKAKSFVAIDFVGYNYVVRDNSIMTSVSQDKLLKKANDMLFHFDFLFDKFNNELKLSDDLKKRLNSFIANAIINKGKSLSKSNRTYYKKQLDQRNVYECLLDDTFFRKAKKFLIKHNYYLYLKLFCK